jgi:hypothetical protein
MTTTAPRQDSERPGAERDAWARYREDLRGLAGREYEDAERASWDRLQRRLGEIEGRGERQA